MNSPEELTKSMPHCPLVILDHPAGPNENDESRGSLEHEYFNFGYLGWKGKRNRAKEQGGA